MLKKLKNNINKIIKLFLIILFACTNFIYIYTKYNINSQEKEKQHRFFNIKNYNGINTINNNISIDEDYIMILDIPKLNIKKGIYNYNSKYNNVDQNIMILKQSEMPDVKNSNLLLAAHSGNSNVSYFKNLIDLNKDDEIIIYYSGYKYIYKLNNYYKDIKDGQITINRNIDKNTLTLITCDKYDKNYQLIFIAYLFDINKY